MIHPYYQLAQLSTAIHALGSSFFWGYTKVYQTSGVLSIGFLNLFSLVQIHAKAFVYYPAAMNAGSITKIMNVLSH
jgi:hypothetical protein